MKINKTYLTLNLTLITLFTGTAANVSAYPIITNEDKIFTASKIHDMGSQSYTANGEYDISFSRDGYSFVDAPPPPPPPLPPVEQPAPLPKDTNVNFKKFVNPPTVTPDPGSAQAYAQTAVSNRGWGNEQFNCLVSLWNKESGWRVNAENKSSGAYGIPQALPGSKMASAGADWQTNAGTQIEWGLGYIKGRYGTPCEAWSHSQAKNWY